MSSFTFTIPGQPMSWNRSYRQRVVKVRDGNGQPTGKSRGGMFKTAEAETYQDTVRWLAKLAKPKGFAPTEVIVAYDFTLWRDIDCDNVMKMINDALAEAIDLNDRYFYPTVLSKATGSKTPSVTVTVYDRAEWQVQVVPVDFEGLVRRSGIQTEAEAALAEYRRG